MPKIPIQLGHTPKEEEKKKNIIVGIDLGTTNSLISYIDDYGDPQVIHGAASGAIIPSVIFFDEKHQPTVGEDARKKAVSHPARTIFSVKRLMGKSYHDEGVQDARLAYALKDFSEEGLVRVAIDDTYYTPIELSALILGELKDIAEAHLGQEVTQTVITVPAYFDDAQRQATKDAGKLAGLDVLRIVNEPTAASLAYGYLPDAEPKKVAVYDLGGGTFDLSILELNEGIFDVLATHGDTHLGGDDIDMAIVAWMTNGMGVPPHPSLRWHARDLKHQLSDLDSASVTIENKEIGLSLDQLKSIVQPIIQRTLDLFEKSIRDAELELSDLDDVLLVGGSTRMPLIREAVAKFAGREVNTSIDPDTAVAMGAALQGDILAGNRTDLLLLDITPLSLGIETLGGLMDVLLPRNSKIPSAVGRSYTTSVDGQISLKVAVYQGERDLVEHNRKLGEFILSGIPPMPAGIPKIEIKFLIDADGILQVTAKELRSGTEQHIQIKASYGLTEEEMAQMLLDSIEHAEDDMKIRGLKEAQNEAQQLVGATDKFIEQNQDWMSEEQIKHITLLAKDLEDSIKSADKDQIHTLMDSLNTYTRPLAEIAMDRQIKNSLRGQHTDRIG